MTTSRARGWAVLVVVVVARAAIAAAAGPAGEPPKRSAAGPYYPGPLDAWERRTPQQAGMDPALVTRINGVFN